MDPFQWFDDAYRRLVTAGKPLLSLGTPQQVAEFQEHYRVTKEVAAVVNDFRAPPWDEPDPTLVRRLKRSFAETGSSNPPPGWNQQALAYAALLLRDFIPAYESVIEDPILPVVPADFVATPTSLVEASTGRLIGFKSSPINRFWGTQNHSSSGKREVPAKWPGAILELAAGRYPHSRLSQPWSSADAVSTIRAAVPGTAFILPHPVGGSDSFYLEWAALCRLIGLVFLPDDRAALKTENPGSKRWNGRHPMFPDVEILDCLFGTGGQDADSWNAETDTGERDAKWLRHAYDIGTSVEGREYGWVIDGMCGRPDLGLVWDDAWNPETGFFKATVWEGGVFKEHEGYDHSVLAPGRRMSRRRARWGRRTFDQITNRAGESSNSDGDVLNEFHEVEDFCLEDGGGGSIYTIKGHDGEATYRDIVVRMGMNPRLHPSVQGNITGAFVCEFQRNRPCRKITLDRWHVSRGKEFAGKGSARRPLFAVQAAAEFHLGEIIARQFKDQSGQLPAEVLAFGDPFGGRGMSNIGRVTLRRPNKSTVHLEGKVVWGGRNFPDDGLTGKGYESFVADVEKNPSNYPQVTLVG